MRVELEFDIATAICPWASAASASTTGRPVPAGLGAGIAHERTWPVLVSILIKVEFRPSHATPVAVTAKPLALPVRRRLDSGRTGQVFSVSFRFR